jgi:N-acetylmuramoyl-L-alanine amidase
MFTSLSYQARYWAVAQRRRLAYYWLDRDKTSLVFLAMLALVVAALSGIAYFAYVDGTRIRPAEILAAQRQAERARRRAEDLQCLAENVYFEARGEPLDGQYAVAEVTLNRTHAPNFPRTICAVVHETRWDPGRRRFVADFSWTELRAPALPDGPAWKQAVTVAAAAYDELRAPLVPDALFYHATSIRPGWANSRRRVATIGNHIFYR